MTNVFLYSTGLEANGRRSELAHYKFGHDKGHRAPGNRGVRACAYDRSSAPRCRPRSSEEIQAGFGPLWSKASSAFAQRLASTP